MFRKLVKFLKNYNIYVVASFCLVVLILSILFCLVFPAVLNINIISRGRVEFLKNYNIYVVASFCLVVLILSILFSKV